MFDTEQIKVLTIKEITGNIGPEEETLLLKLRMEDSEAEEYYQQLRNKFARVEVNQAVEELEKDDSFDIYLQMAVKKRKNLPFRLAAGAAACVLVSLSIFGIIKLTTVDTKIPAPLQEKGITLTMPNGTKVELSSQTGQVRVGNVTLKNSQNTLSYSGSTGSLDGLATLNIPAGKDYTLQLSDGTKIQLNSSSSITFPFAFTGPTRDIRLNGEAYFKVALDPGKPFMVHVLANGSTQGDIDEALIRVLGTEFNINNYNRNTVQVALVEGSVSLQAGTDSLQLSPGFEAIYKSKERIRIKSFDENEVLSWRKGIIEFNNATLADVFETLPRWYGIELEVRNKDLSGRSFTGSLDRNKSPEYFLEQLSFTHNIRYEHKGDIVIIK